MFIQTWNKYLPVIKILLKRAVTTEQTLDMNKSDFQRAAGGKKLKFAFSINLVRGRTREVDNSPATAKNLITVLQTDDTTNKLIRQNEFEFTMNSNFQLLIKNSRAAEPEPVTEEATTPGKEGNEGDESTRAE